MDCLPPPPGYSNRVPFPEEDALEDIYDDIIGNLIVIPGHRPEGILSFPHSSIFSSVHPELMTSEHMITLVRERLNQQISESGEAGPDIRQKLVKLFCINTAKKRSLDHVDLWAFFDSVLDDSFEELETHAVFRGAEPHALLIPTIAKRSPNLKKLKLNFKFECNQSNGMRVFPNLKKLRVLFQLGLTQSCPKPVPIIQSLDFLHHLTSLTLYHIASYAGENSALTLIGKACPSLSHLRLAKCNPTSKYDIIAIVLGELAAHLIGSQERHEEQPYWRFKQVDWAEDAALGRLRVPPEFLTPVCFSLRHLELVEYLDHHYYPAIDPGIAAFIIRHLPSLEKLESCSGTEKAVHLLHNESEEAEESPGSIQSDFEQACRDAISLHGLTLRNPRETEERPSSTFTGTLSLTKLEHLNIQDKNIAEMLRAIQLTCPYLKDVTFGEKKKGDGLRSSRMHWPALVQMKDDARPASGLSLDSDAHQRLELALSKWPKLESITFVKVSPDYIKTILNVFHKDLKELSFTGCKLINLTDLARCTQLQSLRISSTCSLDSYESVPELSADSFLPNLKSLSCKICLGAVSSVFEEKSTLKRLILKCCHKDIRECIQSKWRSLEILHLQRCSGLVDMSMVSRLVDELVELVELFLPCRLEYNDPTRLAPEILHKAFTKPTPLNLQYKFYYRVYCLLDPMNEAAGNNHAGSLMLEAVGSPSSGSSDDPMSEAVDNNPSGPMMLEAADSSSSGSSDDSPARSIHSTTDYDPDESMDELYHDSE